MSKSAVVTIGIVLLVFGATSLLVVAARLAGAGASLGDSNTNAALTVIGLGLAAAGLAVTILGLRRPAPAHAGSTRLKANAARPKRSQTRLAIAAIIFVWILFIAGPLIERLEVMDASGRGAYLAFAALLLVAVALVWLIDPLKSAHYRGVDEIYGMFSMNIAVAITTEPVLPTENSPALVAGSIGAVQLVITFIAIYYARHYARSKERSSAWGWMMLLNLIGIIILARLTDRTEHTTASNDAPSHGSGEHPI
jgi:hypothetical protein